MKKIISKTIHFRGVVCDQKDGKYYMVFCCAVKQRGKKKALTHTLYLGGKEKVDIRNFTKCKPLIEVDA